MELIRGKMVPENLEEAMTEIKNLMMKAKEGMFTEFTNAPEEEAVVGLHKTLGLWIRNQWGFWGNSKLKQWLIQQGFTHADDMSTALLTFTHRNENGVPLKIEEEVAKYKKYWEEQENGS